MSWYHKALRIVPGRIRATSVLILNIINQLTNSSSLPLPWWALPTTAVLHPLPYCCSPTTASLFCISLDSVALRTHSRLGPRAIAQRPRKVKELPRGYRRQAWLSGYQATAFSNTFLDCSSSDVPSLSPTLKH